MPLVPKSIRDLSPYVPGPRAQDMRRLFGLDRVVALGSNENPLGPSPRAVEAAREALLHAHRYPDPASRDLRAALAERFSVPAGQIIMGAGSDALLATIVRSFLLPHEEMITAHGSFIGFTVHAAASGRTLHKLPRVDYRYDLEAMADGIDEYTKLVYIANPDNPMGTWVTKGELAAFMERVPPHVLVVLDEAYFEFACSEPTYPDSTELGCDNLITLRTFSKAHGLAGQRMGYAFASERLVTELSKIKPPFESNVAGQAAALAALGDTEHAERTVRNNAEGMAELVPVLEGLGLEVVPSRANFVAFGLPNADAAQQVFLALRRRGVLTRPLAGWGWPNHIRVTIGTPEDRAFFVTQLEEVLRSA